jgi:hypothetical protein
MKILLASMAAFFVPFADQTKADFDARYSLDIPESFELAPPLGMDDPWLWSLVGNLTERANRGPHPYSVWRLTNIRDCTFNDRLSRCSVFSRDEKDNRFLVWSQTCEAHHGGRPWLVSWDHGAVYEAGGDATSYYLSPSGRYFVVFAPPRYGATFTSGRLSPRRRIMHAGETAIADFVAGVYRWQYTLGIGGDGRRSASWSKLSPAMKHQ